LKKDNIKNPFTSGVINMVKHIHKNLIAMMFFVLLPGCTSMQFADVFQGYSSQMKPVKLAQRQGDFTKAQNTLLERSVTNNNYALGLLERARLQFLASDWQASQKSFSLAYTQIEQQRNKAKIQLSKGIEQFGSVISNDNVISYQVPYYEQGMLHSYQALNYLFQNNLEAALVEIRRANLVQENALKAYGNEVHDAEELYKSAVSTDSLNNLYTSMTDSIGDVKNGFQNAFTFYLSGILYEASGELNDAYIDYKRAVEIYPQNKYLQQDVLRLANQLGMQDDLVNFQQRFGEYQSPNVAGQGQVVVIFEQDIVNSKEDVSLNLPIDRSHKEIKFLSFSLPVYRDALPQHNVLTVSNAGKVYESNEIVRIQSLAAKNLQDQLPALLTRQVIRVIAKEKMRQKLSREGGDIGNILASIYNIASERADTRSWSTLPDEVDIVRMNVPAGKQLLQVQVRGQQQSIEVDVQPNRITLVKLSAIGHYTDYHSINL
jgi:hypothetical protein